MQKKKTKRKQWEKTRNKRKRKEKKKPQRNKTKWKVRKPVGDTNEILFNIIYLEAARRVIWRPPDRYIDLFCNNNVKHATNMSY